MKHNCNWS